MWLNTDQEWKKLINLIVFVSPNGQLPQQRQLTSKIFFTLGIFRAKVDPIALPFMALTHVVDIGGRWLVNGCTS